MGDQLLLGSCSFQNYGCGDFLAVNFVLYAKANGLSNRGVPSQYLIDFPGRYLLAPAIYQFLYPADQAQVPFGIQLALVPSPKPAIRKCFRICLGIALISGENIGSLDGNFSLSSRLQNVALLVKNCNINVGPAPYRSGLSFIWRQRV